MIDDYDSSDPSQILVLTYFLAHNFSTKKIEVFLGRLVILAQLHYPSLKFCKEFPQRHIHLSSL